MRNKVVNHSEVQRIALNLKLAREALGLTPAELCRMTGISSNTYSQWENAKGRPSLSEAYKLREALGYTLDWIYLGDPSGLPIRIASRLPPPRAA